MGDGAALPSGRDIWEVANQLEGYVDMTTPDDLAAFLLREGKAASELAATLATLQAKLVEKDAEIEKLKVERDGEREACAALAAGYAELEIRDDFDRGYTKAADRIAARIRDRCFGPRPALTGESDG